MPAILVDRLDRPVEEAVGSARGLGDFLAAHRGQLIDLLAELRAVGVEAGQFINELRDATVELGRFLGLQRDEARRLGRRNRLERIGRIELELRRSACSGRSLRSRFGRHCVILSVPLCGAPQGRSTPHQGFELYYRYKTRQFKNVSARDIVTFP